MTMTTHTFKLERCPIENPHACLGYRCQLHGVCDFNRRMDREKREHIAYGVTEDK